MTKLKTNSKPKKLTAIEPSRLNRAKLKAVLKKFKRKKILVIGDVGIDKYVIGSVERISPEAPVPIVHVRDEKLKLGLAANVAENIKVLGGSPAICGVIGRDRGGEDFLRLLRKSRIDTDHLVTDSKRRTVLKERVVSERQQLLRIDYEDLQKTSQKAEATLMRKIARVISKADAVVIEDYAKGMITPRLVKKVFSLAKKAGKLTFVDPNAKAPLSSYLGASVLTPNTMEAEQLTGIQITNERKLIEAGEMLLKMCRAEHVIITRGKAGMAVFSKNKRQGFWVQTFAREVYDVSGAGDTVISVLALALASGAQIEEAVILGNLAAGVEVGKRGTATVTTREIELAMEFFDSMRV